MEIGAPKDRLRTSARVNWLLRQLAKTTDQEIIIKAKWPGRASDTQKTLGFLREDQTFAQESGSKVAPRVFEILIVRDLAGKFSGSRSFIEALEKVVPYYYQQVGQYLKQWQPAPPKPRGASVVSGPADIVDDNDQTVGTATCAKPDSKEA